MQVTTHFLSALVQAAITQATLFAPGKKRATVARHSSPRTLNSTGYPACFVAIIRSGLHLTLSLQCYTKFKTRMEGERGAGRNDITSLKIVIILHLNSIHHYFKRNILKCWLSFSLNFSKKNSQGKKECILYVNKAEYNR